MPYTLLLLLEITLLKDAVSVFPRTKRQRGNSFRPYLIFKNAPLLLALTKTEC